jgi:hypothetical protein
MRLNKYLLTILLIYLSKSLLLSQVNKYPELNLHNNWNWKDKFNIVDVLGLPVDNPGVQLVLKDLGWRVKGNEIVHSRLNDKLLVSDGYVNTYVCHDRMRYLLNTYLFNDEIIMHSSLKDFFKESKGEFYYSKIKTDEKNVKLYRITSKDEFNSTLRYTLEGKDYKLEKIEFNLLSIKDPGSHFDYIHMNKYVRHTNVTAKIREVLDDYKFEGWKLVKFSTSLHHNTQLDYKKGKSYLLFVISPSGSWEWGNEPHLKNPFNYVMSTYKYPYNGKLDLSYTINNNKDATIFNNGDTTESGYMEWMQLKFYDTLDSKLSLFTPKSENKFYMIFEKEGVVDDALNVREIIMPKSSIETRLDAMMKRKGFVYSHKFSLQNFHNGQEGSERSGNFMPYERGDTLRYVMVNKKDQTAGKLYCELLFKNKIHSRPISRSYLNQVNLGSNYLVYNFTLRQNLVSANVRFRLKMDKPNYKGIPEVFVYRDTLGRDTSNYKDFEIVKLKPLSDQVILETWQNELMLTELEKKRIKGKKHTGFKSVKRYVGKLDEYGRANLGLISVVGGSNYKFVVLQKTRSQYDLNLLIYKSSAIVFSHDLSQAIGENKAQSKEINWSPVKGVTASAFLRGSPHLEFYILIFSNHVPESVDAIE